MNDIQMAETINRVKKVEGADLNVEGRKAFKAVSQLAESELSSLNRFVKRETSVLLFI